MTESSLKMNELSSAFYPAATCLAYGVLMSGLNVAAAASPHSREDEVFKSKLALVPDFHFGEKVASVFDDMLERSVPFYAEIQRMIAEMASDFAVTGTNVYDLGCSTGTTLLLLDRH